MLKKFLIVFFLEILLLTPIPSYAGPAQKLTRGAVNVVTAPLEIPKQTRIYWKKGAQKTPHIIVWIMSGIAKGSAETVKRFGSGAWDVLSFPFACPADYQPLLKPDYVFQNSD